MNIMQGKKGVIFGVSNKHGIAYAIAQKLFEEKGYEDKNAILQWNERSSTNINILRTIPAKANFFSRNALSDFEISRRFGNQFSCGFRIDHAAGFNICLRRNNIGFHQKIIFCLWL